MGCYKVKPSVFLSPSARITFPFYFSAMCDAARGDLTSSRHHVVAFSSHQNHHEPNKPLFFIDYPMSGIL
jgi:hypothetical protein